MKCGLYYFIVSNLHKKKKEKEKETRTSDFAQTSDQVVLTTRVALDLPLDDR